MENLKKSKRLQCWLKRFGTNRGYLILDTELNGCSLKWCEYPRAILMDLASLFSTEQRTALCDPNGIFCCWLKTIEKVNKKCSSFRFDFTCRLDSQTLIRNIWLLPLSIISLFNYLFSFVFCKFSKQTEAEWMTIAVWNNYSELKGVLRLFCLTSNRRNGWNDFLK